MGKSEAEMMEGTEDTVTNTSPSQNTSNSARHSDMGDGLDEKMEHGVKESLDEDNEKKKAIILEACRKGDLDALRALAESPGGFLADSIRQQACKCSLGL